MALRTAGQQCFPGRAAAPRAPPSAPRLMSQSGCELGPLIIKTIITIVTMSITITAIITTIITLIMMIIIIIMIMLIILKVLVCYVCIYIYIYIHTHMYIHTHTRNGRLQTRRSLCHGTRAAKLSPHVRVLFCGQHTFDLQQQEWSGGDVAATGISARS